MDLPRETYSLRVRFGPAVFALLPLAVTSAIIIEQTLSSVLLSLPVLLAVVGILSGEVRDRGKKAELSLFPLGLPTSLGLVDSAGDSAKFRAMVAALSGESRLDDPERRDRATAIVRQRLNADPANRQLLRESEEYAFRRNTYALKRPGTLLSGLACIVSVVWWFYAPTEIHPHIATAFTVSAATLVFWLLRVSPEWVQVAADRYADQFYLSAEVAKGSIQA